MGQTKTKKYDTPPHPTPSLPIILEDNFDDAYRKLKNKFSKII